ncbi:MAG: PDZ domain-containing protein [Caldilineae bacterium]|nr:MAG: PDZ domain-containing protein [Caldilineae bacterium]
MRQNRTLLTCLLFMVLAVACGLGLVGGAVVAGRVPAVQMLLATPTPLPPTPAPTATPFPTPTPLPPPPSGQSYLDPEQRLIQLYRDASPAVVNINTQILRRDFFFGIIPESGSGSGFVWDEAGHILTNYHVIEGAQTIEVSFGDDLVFPAEVVGSDPPNDLAVLRVEQLPPGVSPLPLGDSDALQVGQTAVSIGNPFGQFQRTLTAGVISALNRTIQLDEERVLRGVIQTDADINRGNSGGPLLDSSGRVIGITTAIFSPTGANAGVGLAIPINKAKRVVPVLIQEGRYRHPWLGIEHLGYALNSTLARVLDLPVDHGLLIARVYRNSPAQRAGIRTATREVIIGNRRFLIGGDVLTAIDGVPLKTWEDLDAYLQEETEVGQTVTLEIVRDGRPMSLQVEVGEEPTRSF